MSTNEEKKIEEPEVSRKTLGEQYVENFDIDDKGYETRNIVEEYGKNRFGPMLDEIIKNHKDFAKKYYIWIVNQDVPILDVTTKKINFVVRKSRPTPKWETILFSYDNSNNDLRLEWVLPTKEGGEAMLESPDGWDPMLIDHLYENLDSLQAQEARILSQGNIFQEPPGAHRIDLSGF